MSSYLAISKVLLIDDLITTVETLNTGLNKIPAEVCPLLHAKKTETLKCACVLQNTSLAYGTTTNILWGYGYG